MDMAPIDNPGIELRQREARETIRKLNRLEDGIRGEFYTIEYTKPISLIANGIHLCLKMLVDLHEKEFGKAPKEEDE
jgi:hypothetical protein